MASAADGVEQTRADMVRARAVTNYRVEDFAASFGVSVRHAWRLIETGKIEAKRSGRRVLITAESAHAWNASLPRVAARGSV